MGLQLSKRFGERLIILGSIFLRWIIHFSFKLVSRLGRISARIVMLTAFSLDSLLAEVRGYISSNLWRLLSTHLWLALIDCP
jgi:hypothetical protein